MTCGGCGAINPTNARFCWRCGKRIEGTAPPPPPPERGLGDDAGVRMLIPVGRSGLAIAAGYLGLFSLILIPAPFAVLVSILALNELNRKPQLHGAGRAYFGLIMGVLGTAGLVIVVFAQVFG